MKLAITQTKSTIACLKDQIATIRALGLRGLLGLALLRKGDIGCALARRNTIGITTPARRCGT